MMLLEMASQTAPDRVAFGPMDGGMTYERLYDLAARGATFLRARPGERLLYTDESSPALPVALFAASWAGQPFVPLSYRLADDRLQALVGGQAPAFLLHADSDADRTAGIEGVEQLSSGDFLRAIEAEEPAEPDWSYDGEDIAILLHTSGTSGLPKVAILRQRHLVSYVFGSVELLGAGEDEATLASVPPYHIAGMAGILTASYGGRRLVQLPSFEPDEWVHLAHAEHITHAMVVPTMLGRILEVLEREEESLPSLRHLSYGGGRMPVPTIEKAMRLLPGVDFVNAYGLTETSSSIAVLGPEEHREALSSDEPAVRARLASVGRPLPSVEVSIRDAEGEVVALGQRGEVWVRGDQVSGEYKGSSLLDAEGWFPTKDAGYIDEEGFLFLDGRIDDVIIRGGENLSPGEIEDVLLLHPAIQDAVVLGLPDVEWGEVVAAVIVPEEGAVVDEDDIRTWVTQHLRSSRAPAVVDVRTELPYNETGKVLRRVLRPELAERHPPAATS